MVPFVIFLFSLLLGSGQTWAFSGVSRTSFQRYQRRTTFLLRAEASDVDPSELVAKRITVKGDVQGGYYRVCVRNEAGRFRRLVGTMTPPDDTDEAEIYVEGKRKLVEGFVRWCKKGDVGLSQVVHVEQVVDEDPTGLYDDFYVKVKNE